MNNLETVLSMWKEDCIIDNSALDQTTINLAALHSKYLEMLSNAKLTLKYLNAQLDLLLKDKWLYYNGKMTKQEMDDKGWKYDPFNGLRVIKGEMDYYYNSDTDIQSAKAKIDYQKTVVEAIDEIMGTIRWRHQAIKNIIDFKKFEAGM